MLSRKRDWRKGERSEEMDKNRLVRERGKGREREKDAGGSGREERRIQE